MISLITPEDIQEWVDVSLTIEPRLITTHIYVCQDRYIKPILCEDLYNDLVLHYEAGDASDVYLELLEKIKPTLTFRVYSRYLNRANVSSTEKGLRTFKEDYSDAITDKRTGELIRQADGDAMAYELELKSWLCANKPRLNGLGECCNCGSSSGFKMTTIGKSARKSRSQDKLYNDLLDNQ
jgi:hypothetical protein